MQILGSYPSTSPSLWFILIMAIGAAGVILTFYCMVKIKEISSDLVVGIFAFITLVCVVTMFIIPSEVPNGRISYVIEMNDTIDYNEFYEKYKVIDHYEYTNIYIVEEK